MIHGLEYSIKSDEFTLRKIPEFSPLELRDDLSYFDREIGIINKILSEFMEAIYIDVHTTHGGYIPLNISLSSSSPQNMYVIPQEGHTIPQKESITVLESTTDPLSFPYNTIIRVNRGVKFPSLVSHPILVISDDITIEKYKKIKISSTNRVININENYWTIIESIFGDKIAGGVLYYDNLINLLIMVKNAGDGFEDMLMKNIPYVDRLTVLDTGSTDNTINIVKKVLEKIDGKLYEEPFINFRDSRNRLIELAGDVCSYNLMLDDTYVIQGGVKVIRDYLSVIRSDDVADGLSITINSTDIQYGSVRLSRTHKRRKYKYTIHEILDCELSVSLPQDIIQINDLGSPYMSERTLERKELDLKLLFNELKQNPNDHRTLYYIGETYTCQHKWKEADEWYVKTMHGHGYEEEVYDAYYKHAVFNYLYFNTDIQTCERLFMDTYNYKKRYEPLFMIGYMNFNAGNFEKAYTCLKQAWATGFPVESGMNLKVLQYYLHLPKMLYKLAFEREDFETCTRCIESVLKHEPDNAEVAYFKSMVETINANYLYRGIKKRRYSESKLICFVIDGGWDYWDGRSILTKGLGGSETSVIRYAETIAKMEGYSSLVFCRCKEDVIYNNVSYRPIESLIEFVSLYYIDLVILNRYCELTPIITLNKHKTLLVLHDLSREGDVIVDSPYLHGVYGISNHHCEYIKKRHPNICNKVKLFSYGIDRFKTEGGKVPYSFIYSSFPTRGLLNLLEIWGDILRKYPTAVLNVFCDLDHSWSNRVEPEKMQKIKELMKQKNITNHGWVDNKTLRKYWGSSHVWLYPCDFIETCCLTAWEASASKTLAITSDWGALTESVGNRGIMISGDPKSKEWRDECLKKLFDVIDNSKEKEYVYRNYAWSLEKSYDNVVEQFLSNLSESA
jgi:tetratricopeptide (TPR) repeat protein